MKPAVSINLGRLAGQGGEDHLLEEKVSVERGGTDGDMEKAAQLYREVDGKMDAFGVGIVF